MITTYYNVLLGQALIYMCYSFTSPMPWSKDSTAKRNCDPADTSRAEEFYNVNILKYYRAPCEDYSDSDPTTFAGEQYVATLAVWVVIFVCTVRSIRITKYLVWPTVLIPFIFLIVLMVGTLTANGAGQGVKQYMTGESSINVTVEGNLLRKAGLGEN